MPVLFLLRVNALTPLLASIIVTSTSRRPRNTLVRLIKIDQAHWIWMQFLITENQMHQAYSRRSKYCSAHEAREGEKIHSSSVNVGTVIKVLVKTYCAVLGYANVYRVCSLNLLTCEYFFTLFVFIKNFTHILRKYVLLSK